MSSYISIGIVSKEKEFFFRRALQIMKKNEIYISRLVINYPEDNTYNLWKNQNGRIEDIQNMFEKCYKEECAEIVVDYKMKRKIIKGVLIRIIKEKGKYEGILFEIPENNFDMQKNIDVLENKIIVELKDILNIGFDYAFCDNETDIHYSVEEILNQDNMYSILFIKENGTIFSRLGSWKIDGLTMRSL